MLCCVACLGHGLAGFQGGAAGHVPLEVRQGQRAPARLLLRRRAGRGGRGPGPLAPRPPLLPPALLLGCRRGGGRRGRGGGGGGAQGGQLLLEEAGGHGPAGEQWRAREPLACRVPLSVCGSGCVSQSLLTDK